MSIYEKWFFISAIFTLLVSLYLIKAKNLRFLLITISSVLITLAQGFTLIGLNNSVIVVIFCLFAIATLTEFFYG